MDAGDPCQRSDVEFLSHALHPFADDFAEPRLPFLFITTKLLEILFFEADWEVKQVVLLRVSVRVKYAIGGAIR